MAMMTMPNNDDANYNSCR